MYECGGRGICRGKKVGNLYGMFQEHHLKNSEMCEMRIICRKRHIADQCKVQSKFVKLHQDIRIDNKVIRSISAICISCPPSHYETPGRCVFVTKTSI
jgi:hypothetical protein